MLVLCCILSFFVIEIQEKAQVRAKRVFFKQLCFIVSDVDFTQCIPTLLLSSTNRKLLFMYSIASVSMYSVYFRFLLSTSALFWLTFSPISPSTQIYYGISSATVDLLLNWGPILFIPCLPLSYLLFNRKNGLRRTVILLAIAFFVATLLRVIPSIITSPSSPNFRAISLPFIHAGQIINAACGPLAMGPVSQLSSLWFGPGERTRATTLAIMASIFGGTLSFLINPSIVSRPANVPNLLYFHLALAFTAGLLALIFFPAQPPTPPSVAAELLMQGGEQNVGLGLSAFKKGLKQCMTNPSFVLLSTAGGVMSGTFAVWTGLFATILAPEGYSEKQAGKFTIFFCMGYLLFQTSFRSCQIYDTENSNPTTYFSLPHKY